MKALIFGKNKERITPLVLRAGFSVVENDPDFVVSYGGDGTLMMAERAHPGIPVVLLKDSQICKKCSPLSNEEVLSRVVAGRYAIEHLMKLEVSAEGKILRTINDIILHNKDPRHAIRYNFSVQGRPFKREVIGDGVVLATPFGSTAYYRSITDSFFELGIGVAFNNSTEQSDHVVLKEESIITISITRGSATIYADNQKDEIQVDEKSQIIVRKSTETAPIVIPDL